MAIAELRRDGEPQGENLVEVRSTVCAKVTAELKRLGYNPFAKDEESIGARLVIPEIVLSPPAAERLQGEKMGVINFYCGSVPNRSTAHVNRIDNPANFDSIWEVRTKDEIVAFEIRTTGTTELKNVSDYGLRPVISLNEPPYDLLLGSRHSGKEGVILLFHPPYTIDSSSMPLVAGGLILPANWRDVFSARGKLLSKDNLNTKKSEVAAAPAVEREEVTPALLGGGWPKLQPRLDTRAVEEEIRRGKGNIDTFIERHASRSAASPVEVEAGGSAKQRRRLARPVEVSQEPAPVTPRVESGINPLDSIKVKVRELPNREGRTSKWTACIDQGKMPNTAVDIDDDGLGSYTLVIHVDEAGAKRFQELSQSGWNVDSVTKILGTSQQDTRDRIKMRVTTKGIEVTTTKFDMLSLKDQLTGQAFSLPKYVFEDIVNSLEAPYRSY